MPFVANTFVDGVAGGTPITAATLNNLEQGLLAADITNPASAAGVVLSGYTATSGLDSAVAGYFGAVSATRTAADARYLGGSGDTGWLAYTSTVGGITVGNGTLIARYRQRSKSVDVAIQFTLGSTSAVTGAISFSLPVAMAQAMAVQAYGNFNQAGSYYTAQALFISSQLYVEAINVAGTYAALANTSATVPFTWATGHIVQAGGTYENV